MEPQCKLRSIHLICSDGLFIDQLLDLLGLQRLAEAGSKEGTDLVWDSHHLGTAIWHNEEHGLGQQTHGLVREDMT